MSRDVTHLVKSAQGDLQRDILLTAGGNAPAKFAQDGRVDGQHHAPPGKTMTRRASLALTMPLTSLFAQPMLAVSLPSCDAPRAIHFARGASSAVVTGPVLQGEDVCYTITAKAGQAFSATVTSPDDNVEFQLYRPGYTTTHDTDGSSLDGATVKGAGSNDDARHVALTLPETGTYVFLLGTERGGGGTYRLTVSIVP